MQADGNDAEKARPPVAEMVGATSAPFFIGAAPTQISLPMHAPTGPARETPAAQKQVFLIIENVTSVKRSPSFGVYLNVPPGDDPARHPDLFAGSLGMFGLAESTDPSREHAGNGLSFTLEITELVARLIAGRAWDPNNVKLSFAPKAWDAAVPQVKVGRVSVYLQ